MVVSNSACLVEDWRLSAVVEDLDFLKLPRDALFFPSNPPRARLNIYIKKNLIKNEAIFIGYIYWIYPSALFQCINHGFSIDFIEFRREFCSFIVQLIIMIIAFIRMNTSG